MCLVYEGPAPSAPAMVAYLVWEFLHFSKIETAMKAARPANTPRSTKQKNWSGEERERGGGGG